MIVSARLSNASRVVVDDRDGVSLVLEHLRDVAADPAVSADDDVHPRTHLGLASVIRSPPRLAERHE